MLRRRDFLKTASVAAAGAFLPQMSGAIEVHEDTAEEFHFSSESLELQLSVTAPEFLSLNIDGLGKGRRGANIVAANGAGKGYQTSSFTAGGVRRVEYHVPGASQDAPPPWTFEFSGNRVVIMSQWSADFAPSPMIFHFDLSQVHSTVLGVFRKDDLLAVPALMHFPGQGSMRLTANVGDIGLGYTSDRPHSTAKLSLPGASQEHKRIVYTLV